MTERATTGQPIGILAGNGSLPREVAAAARAAGRSVQIVALDGEIDPGLNAYPLVSLPWGQMARLFSTLRSAHCQELVIIGGVSRPDLTRLRPDWGFVANSYRLVQLVLAGGDDGVLRAFVRILELNGFTVVAPGSVAPGLVVGSGVMGHIGPNQGDAADMLLGSAIVRALGVHDIGQGVIVGQGRIEAIEAVEGTDRMLARVAQRRGAQAGGPARSGVLVKRPKPGQELRVDLPTIGPLTVARAADAGLAGIAVLAGQTLAAERATLVAQANAAGLFVYGFDEGDAPAPVAAARATGTIRAAPLGRVRLSGQQRADVHAGAQVLASLAALAGDGVAIVNRGHVLGLEPGGDWQAVVSRVAQLKQWGESRWRARAGVAVVGADVPITAQMIEAAARANLAGVATTGDASSHGLTDAVRSADRLAVFIANITSQPREKGSR
jgi:DUF1009 family protein